MHMLQYARSLKTWCQAQEARHKGPHVTGFHLYETPRTGNSIDSKEVRACLGLKGWGRGFPPEQRAWGFFLR